MIYVIRDDPLGGKFPELSPDIGFCDLLSGLGDHQCERPLGPSPSFGAVGIAAEVVHLPPRIAPQTGKGAGPKAPPLSAPGTGAANPNAAPRVSKGPLINN